MYTVPQPSKEKIRIAKMAMATVLLLQVHQNNKTMLM